MDVERKCLVAEKMESIGGCREVEEKGILVIIIST